MVSDPCQRIHHDAANFAPRVNCSTNVPPAMAPRQKRLSYIRQSPPSKAGAARQRARRRKSTTSFVVACGCSSVIQCPQSGMITSSTLAATHRVTAPIIGPNVASPPKAKTGI